VPTADRGVSGIVTDLDTGGVEPGGEASLAHDLAHLPINAPCSHSCCIAHQLNPITVLRAGMGSGASYLWLSIRSKAIPTAPMAASSGRTLDALGRR